MNVYRELFTSAQGIELGERPMWTFEMHSTGTRRHRYSAIVLEFAMNGHDEAWVLVEKARDEDASNVSRYIQHNPREG